MPRIRTIKPDFWTDEKIVELTPWARLLFVGLWNFADDEGRMEWSLRRIKMQVFPADEIDLAPICADLRRLALIFVYTSARKEYMQIVHWEKHQKIDRRRKSKFPAPICADLRRALEAVETEGTYDFERAENQVEVSPPAPTCADLRRLAPTEEEEEEEKETTPLPPANADDSENAVGGEVGKDFWKRIQKAFPSIRKRGLSPDQVFPVLDGANGNAARMLAVLAEACADDSVRHPPAVVRHRLSATPPGKRNVRRAEAVLDPPKNARTCSCGKPLRQEYAPGSGKTELVCECGRSWPREAVL